MARLPPLFPAGSTKYNVHNVYTYIYIYIYVIYIYTYITYVYIYIYIYTYYIYYIYIYMQRQHPHTTHGNLKRIALRADSRLATRDYPRLEQFGDLQKLRVLDLSFNKFSWRPTTFRKQLSHLEPLHLEEMRPWGLVLENSALVKFAHLSCT